MNDLLLEVKALKKYFPIRKNIFFSKKTFVHAVDDVAFLLKQGQTVGLVGESGCGKTTLGRLIALLEKPTAGNIIFKQENIATLKKRELKEYRKSVQLIFQDPYSSLNPRKTVYEIITTGIRSFRLIKTRKEIREKAALLLELVGLSTEYLNNYPHEFSGGQRQRISIARALALSPKLLICDEPVSALDVSIQAQILNLLNSLKHKLNLAYIFISHDLAVVRHVSDQIFVMYRGKIIEKAPALDLFKNTTHPYSKALISAIPEATLKKEKGRIILKGDVTTPVGKIKGCCFAERCYMAKKLCREESPEEREINPGHFTSCHFSEKV